MPSISYGDAISNHALEIRSILKAWGYESEIYAQHIHPKLSNIARAYTGYKKVSSAENGLIFHFSIGSEISQFVKILPDKKILIYHNITPPIFFSGVNDTIAHLLRRGREELAEYHDRVDLALGDSEYNRKELTEIGFKRTGVLPLIVDYDKYAQEPDYKILNEFRDDYTNLIFVGRISPNKKQEDVIKIFYYFNKFNDPQSRLFLIGSYQGTEKYLIQLKELIEKLNLKNVYFTGHVEFEELLAYYKLADLFISMSEHEGFCVPLLESMHFGIPIIAYNSSAIPYTLNGTGILVNEKRYEEIAELAYILVNDRNIKDKIIEKQKERLKQFEKAKIKIMLKKYIEMVIP
jgi:glycosyltransferase involved in cell wall biosynthesis